MKTLIALVVLLTVTSLAFAMTDYGCVSNCTAQGYMYGLCKAQCSW